jgi:hypothetical protein
MKTSELTGAALDWAVAKCEGYEIVRMRGNEITFLDRTEDGALSEKHINYSTDWSQGGPIIEREIISVSHDTAGQTIEWAAWTPAPIRDEAEAFGYGPTPLIAAMRCYVASKLGDEVEIPQELLGE